MSEKTRRPLAVFMQPDYPAIAFLDSVLQERLTPFFNPMENGVDIMSIDQAERRAPLMIYDQTGASFQLVDLQTGSARSLGDSTVRKNADVWVEITPFTFTPKDGMQLNGYLSKHKVNRDKPLPTVLLVHGGRWTRDGWGFSRNVQFLANRGYAVLQVNYRGSSGFGKDYLFANEGEFAGKMHTDLIDAVDWSIEQRTTDADKAAIIGGSYGGYATKPSLPFWFRFIGDASDPEQRKILASRSPIDYSENVQKPLLILCGANDSRVVREHSDRMVDALKAADKEVEYIVIDDEGHGFDYWKHEMTRYRNTENFLASCLGGRSAGLDFFQLGSWAF